MSPRAGSGYGYPLREVLMHLTGGQVIVESRYMPVDLPVLCGSCCTVEVGRYIEISSIYRRYRYIGIGIGTLDIGFFDILISYR